MVALFLAAGCHPHSAAGHDPTPDTVETGDSGGPPDDSGDAPTAASRHPAAFAPRHIPADFDGDGFFADADDCDDTKGNVYPGAPEFCDGLDHNCDGETIPEGSCSEIIDIAASATWEIEGDGTGSFGRPTPVGDVDGDGLYDVLVSRGDHDDSAWGSMFLLPGSALPRAGDITQRDTYVVAGVYPTFAPYTKAGAGDYNADGFDDIWIAGADYAPIGTVGGAYLLLGGADRWEPRTVFVGDDADGYWVDDRENATFGGVMQAVGDLDADGFDDSIAMCALSDEAHVWGLVHGNAAPLPFGASVFDVDGWVNVEGEAFGLSYERAFPSGDLDGDGISDIVVDHDYVVGDSTGMVVIEGEDLADGVWSGDIAQGFWYDDGSGQQLDVWLASLDGGAEHDVDGDGLPNLFGVVEYPETDSTDTTYCTIVAGNGLPTGNLVSDRLALVCSLDDPSDGSESFAAPIGWISHVDADYGADLVVARSTGWWNYEWASCILRSSLLSAGGVVDMLDPEVAPGPCYTYLGTWDPVFLDMTGDGLSEILLGDYDWDSAKYGENAGRLSIVEGFEIPWDDPTKW